ncbi:hypothetical protein D3C75_318860 [compost metagenome]
MNYEPMPEIKRHFLKKRYAYVGNYIVYTVKVGEEKHLEKSITIPSDYELTTEQLTRTIDDLVHNQREAQTEYDNYDLATLHSVSVRVAYDRAIAD